MAEWTESESIWADGFATSKAVDEVARILGYLDFVDVCGRPKPGRFFRKFTDFLFFVFGKPWDGKVQQVFRIHLGNAGSVGQGLYLGASQHGME